ncbi:hypothetical protein ACFV6B_29185 [Streptomyces microflavus]|uniref:hypothetical protein n=1 Tax=Streptomyces microflavus TaxID=1919 RepID=UPI0036594379
MALPEDAQTKDVAVSLPENRLLIVQPGDILVIGHAPAFSAQQADRLKQLLGLKAVIAVPGIVDLATIRAEEQEVQVVVSVPPDAAVSVGEEIRRSVRTKRGGQ